MNLRLLLPLLLFGLISISVSAQKGYSIKGKITGIKDTTIQLGNYYGDKQYLKDSTRVDAQGRFAFEGKEKLDGGIYIVITPDKKYFEILMDSTQHFSFETTTDDLIRDFKVKGSPENQLFYEYLNYINPRGKKAEELKEKLNSEKTKEDEKESAKIKEELRLIEKEVTDFKKSLQEKHPWSFVAKIFKAMEDPEVPEAPLLENGQKDSTFAFKYYRAHYWDNIDWKDDRVLRTPIYHNKLKRYMEQLTIQIPDSINKTADEVLSLAKQSPELFKYTLWYITSTFERSNVMGMDAVFVHLVENYYKKKQAFWIDESTLEKIIQRSDILKPILIGKVAPELYLKDTTDKYVPLLATKGKYTILYFWDPDCGHCQKISPKVHEIWEKYKSKGVTGYAVCTLRDLEKFKKFINDKKLKWINVYDPAPHYNFKDYYDIYSTPVIYLLNEKKEIMFKRISVEQLEEILEKEYEKKEKEKEIK
jgi:thiol-disulfide isomerase/thioredoxin